MSIIDFVMNYYDWWLAVGSMLAYQRYLKAYYQQPKPYLWSEQSIKDFWVFLALMIIWPGLVIDRRSRYYASVTYKQWSDRYLAEREAEIEQVIADHKKSAHDYIESLKKKTHQHRTVPEFLSVKESLDETKT